jgi:DnaJ-class molecular chaperone
MMDAYKVLGLSTNADENTIRSRYLELVRESPPEQFPEKFATIRDAYEQLRDPIKLLKFRLMGPPEPPNLDSLIEQVLKGQSRRRLGLSLLVSVVGKP